MPEKSEIQVGSKKFAILPSNFYNFFVHLKQKVRLRPELSPTFLSSLGPNPTRKARPDLQLWFWQPWLLKTIFLTSNLKLIFSAKLCLQIYSQ